MKKFSMFLAAAAVAACARTGGTGAASQLQITQDLTSCKNTVQQNLSLEATNALLQHLVGGSSAKYDSLKNAGKINARMVDCLKGKGYLAQ